MTTCKKCGAAYDGESDGESVLLRPTCWCFEPDKPADDGNRMALACEIAFRNILRKSDSERNQIEIGYQQKMMRDHPTHCQKIIKEVETELDREITEKISCLGRLRKDDDGHWYLIPLAMVQRYDELFDMICGEIYDDRPDEFDEFINDFDEFRIDNFRNLLVVMPGDPCEQA